eukprot:7495511-Pyramimonas_sp.AAC.2
MEKGHWSEVRDHDRVATPHHGLDREPRLVDARSAPRPPLRLQDLLRAPPLGETAMRRRHH